MDCSTLKLSDLEDGKGDALAGLKPPVLATLAQSGDLGRELGQRRALVGGEQLLQPGPAVAGSFSCLVRWLVCLPSLRSEAF